jgi:hypothetical protein
MELRRGRARRKVGLRKRGERLDSQRISAVVEKVRDLVGLSLNPPIRAVVLPVDDASEIEALNRAVSMVPILRGVLELATDNSRRAGPRRLAKRSVDRQHSRHRGIARRGEHAVESRHTPDIPRRVVEDRVLISQRSIDLVALVSRGLEERIVEPASRSKTLLLVIE